MSVVTFLCVYDQLRNVRNSKDGENDHKKLFNGYGRPTFALGFFHSERGVADRVNVDDDFPEGIALITPFACGPGNAIQFHFPALEFSINSAVHGFFHRFFDGFEFGGGQFEFSQRCLYAFKLKRLQLAVKPMGIM